MVNPKPQMAISISFSMTPEEMAKLYELMELLGKTRSGVVQQAVRELYDRTATEALGANNGQQPA